MTAPRRVPRLADVVNKLARELMALDEGDRQSVLCALCSLGRFWPREGQIPERLSQALRSAVEAGRPNGEDEVVEFWQLEALLGSPRGFFNFWESRGWRDKVGPIRNWRARARVWSEKSVGAPVQTARREAYR